MGRRNARLLLAAHGEVLASSKRNAPVDGQGRHITHLGAATVVDRASIGKTPLAAVYWVGFPLAWSALTLARIFATASSSR
jgi:hypothetical protein